MINVLQNLKEIVVLHFALIIVKAHAFSEKIHLRVRWELTKRNEVPKNVKQTPSPPFVLIMEKARVETLASSETEQNHVRSRRMNMDR